MVLRLAASVVMVVLYGALCVRSTHGSISKPLINAERIQALSGMIESASSVRLQQMVRYNTSGYYTKTAQILSVTTRCDWATLDWAAQIGHVECVELPTAAGAELSPLSDQDSTPLDTALRANQLITTELLTRADARESKK
jgi:ankyrin repeat protein